MTKYKSLSRALSLASFALLLASLPGRAQSSFPTAPRVTSRVEDSVRTRLQGNVSHVIHSAVDQGEGESGTQLTHMRLVLSRSDSQKAAFKSYLAQLQDKSSPNYHKWLTPAQIGKLYAPADSDVVAATAWLESHGLKVESISPSRIDIPFSGTVSQVEEAFQVKIHSFMKGDQHFYANITAPTIPTALTPIVSGIAHLNTMKPRAFSHTSGLGTYDKDAKRHLSLSATKGARSELTNGTPSDLSLALVAGDAATLYDTPNSTFNANFSGSASYSGKGVTIGIGGDSAISTATVVDYRTKFIGDSTSTNLLYTNVDGVSENNDELEAYLDHDVSGGLAPGATLHFYTSSDLFTGIEQALSDNTVDIFSLSFGACEFDWTTSDNQYFNELWSTAAAQGIAVTVSTGDSGSAGCDATSDSQGNSIPDATGGLAVNALASTPWNIAVGGTDLYGLPNNFSKYAPTTEAGNYDRSVVSYIPESTWNNSTSTNTKLADNIPLKGDQANIVGGSGGKSSCSVNTDSVDQNGNFVPGHCTSGYPKPVWQRGSGVPADSARDLPDVSLMAGDGVDAAAWLVCTDDTGDNAKGVQVTANCTTQSDGNYYFLGVGGTSAAAPAFAGILALLQEKTGGRLGQAAIELYDLYNGSNASSVFHDITTGNNSVSCTSGTPNCSKNTAGNYYETGYDTATGYDLATGIGSVDATKLITYWGTATGASTATVKVQPASSSLQSTASLSVTATVSGTFAGAAGSDEVPSGTVTLTSGGYSSAAQAMNSSGAYTFTVPAGSLKTIGSNTLTVAYSGDQYYGTASGSATVTVLEPVATLSGTTLSFGNVLDTVTSAAQTITLKNTGNEALTITGVSITRANASAFAETGNCTGSIAASSSCTISVTFTPASAGAFTASLSIADNATGSPQTVSLTGTGVVPAPAVTLNPTSLGLSAAFGASVAGTVSVTNSGTAPLTVTGIALSGTNASVFSQTNNCSAVAAGAKCTINVTFTPTTLGSATASLTITDNAPGSPQSVTLMGTGTEPSGSAFTLSAAAVSITAGSTGTSAITATGTGGYVGPSTITINSCKLSLGTSGADAPTCSITTPAITFASGANTGSGGVVTISTTAASSSARKAALGNRAGLAGGAGAIAVAGLLLFFPGGKRRWRVLLGAFLLVASIGVLSGCGGSKTPSNPGTPAGSYGFTLLGQDGSGSSQTTTLNVTVN